MRHLYLLPLALLLSQCLAVNLQRNSGLQSRWTQGLLATSSDALKDTLNHLAQQEADLFTPEEYKKIEELSTYDRETVDELVGEGHKDLFRILLAEPKNYTYQDIFSEEEIQQLFARGLNKDLL